MLKRLKKGVRLPWAWTGTGRGAWEEVDTRMRLFVVVGQVKVNEAGPSLCKTGHWDVPVPPLPSLPPHVGANGGPKVFLP